MSYEKQNWATGDVITAEKLNHIEDGIENAGGGTLFAATLSKSYDEEMESDVWTCDKTFAELKAIGENTPILIQDTENYTQVWMTYMPEQSGMFTFPEQFMGSAMYVDGTLVDMRYRIYADFIGVDRFEYTLAPAEETPNQ